MQQSGETDATCSAIRTLLENEISIKTKNADNFLTAFFYPDKPCK